MKSKITNKSHKMVKIEFETEEIKRNLLNKRFIKMGIRKYFLEDFCKQPTQCRKCKGFGHVEIKCVSTLKCGKCGQNYIVFSADIKIIGKPIKMCLDPTFLGIRFDKYLSFKNQLNYLKDVGIKRMNVLKVLSKKSWGLSIKTLTDVYNSLIRSLMEYSSIIYPCFSSTSIDLLEKIQFKSLKIINRK
jgi:hypothetical protein